MSKPITSNDHPVPKPRRRGFTLMETAIAVLLMSLIFLGTIALFTSAGKTGLKVTAANTAAVTSAQAMQSVCDDLKESYWAALPGDTTPVTWPSGFVASNFQNGSYNTGICLYAPVTTSTTLAGMSGSVPLLNRSATGQAAYLIYRGDADDTPNPNGTYLWKQYLQGTQDPSIIAKNIASNPAAVQFRRTSTNSIEVKIVCGEWSREIGEQTSDATDGSKVTGIAGRTVLLRNTSVTTLAVTSGYTNPFATPTPPPPPPTPTPSPSPTPTPRPTPTPTPRPTPTPTPAPTPPPLVGAG